MRIKTILLAMILCLNLSAQKYENNNDAPRLHIGMKLSPSIAWISTINNDLQADGANLKFGVGAVADYNVTSFLSFVTGLNYNGLGGYVFDNQSLNNNSIKGSFKINYSEIEIPIALKLQTAYVNNTSYFLQGGVSVGFLINANEKYFPVAANSDPYYNDISSMTNLTRVAYQLGAGIQYAIGRRSNIFGMISFDNSLSNLASSTYLSGSTPRYTAPLQILPGSMTFSVGIMF